MAATGQVAVVTGAGSGIGRAVASGLLERGYRVALAGRREAPLGATAQTAPERALVIPTDVTDPDAVTSLFHQVAGRWDRLDVLFNNAGRFGTPTPFAQTSLEQWREVIDTNLTGCFLCARAAFALMQTQDPPGGRIINNGSISAHVPRPEAVAYTASKHAVTGLTRTLALEGRAHNIACGQIDIGNAATELSHGISQGIRQADGSTRGEPMMNLANAAEAVLYMAGLPLEANVLFMTVMATGMPYVGRG